MIALCPKCYVSLNDDEIDMKTYEVKKGKVISMKMNGVSKKQNEHITPGDYLDILEKGIKCDGMSVNLGMKNGTMSRISVGKTALTGATKKMVVVENGACMPFITGANYESR